MCGRSRGRDTTPSSIETICLQHSIVLGSTTGTCPEKNLNRCIELAKREQVVLMCAEAVPWRCHRSLIADALVARGVAAAEITSGVRTRPHSLTPWAQVTGTQITYPAAGARPGQSEPGALGPETRR
jgi:uncharacterized protein (DUF488 family)